MLFKYWTISYRPTPFSLDRHGLGVVVESAEGGEVAHRFVRTNTSAFRRHGLGKFLDNQIRVIEDRLRAFRTEQSGLHLGQAVSASHVLQGWAAEWNNAIVVDHSRAIVSESISSALDVLFGQYIGELDPQKRPQRLTQVRTKVRHTYQDSPVISPLLFENPVIESVGTEKAFDFSVGEAGAIYEISSVFNFSKRNSDELLNEVDAWTWRVDGIREGKGNLKLPGSHSESQPIAEDASIVAAIYPAESESQLETFRKATEAWEGLNVKVVEFEQVDRHATLLEQAITAA